ncbi:hypothetical protein IKS73_09900 [bacterium]|nr:hypothetical protein [bacterium]
MTLRHLVTFLSFFLLTLGACASVWPVCDEYRITNTAELSAALRKVESKVLWSKTEEIAKGGNVTAKGKFDPAKGTEEKIERIWAKTLLGLKDKDVYLIQDALTLYREVRQNYPKPMAQRRSFATLAKAHAALRNSMKQEERAEADSWIIARAQDPEFDVDDKTAAMFAPCFKALAAAAVGRQSPGSPEEIRVILSALNGDGVITAMEVGVSMRLLENVCLAAETFANGAYDLYKTDSIKRWAAALAGLRDTADRLPGRGWEGDAPFSPAVTFIVALRYGLAVRDVRSAAMDDPLDAVLYYAKARTAGPSQRMALLSSPAGSGWITARSRVQRGNESRYLRVIKTSGGRYGDLLSFVFSGCGKSQMGRRNWQDGRSVIGRDYMTHTLASSTVVVDFKRQTAASAKILRSANRQGITFLDLDGSDAYPGMKNYRRTFFMTDDYLLDVFTLKSDSPFTAEWVIHSESAKSPVLTGATAPENSYGIKDISKSFLGASYKEPAYQLLDDVASQLASAQWGCDFGNGMRMLMLGQSDTRILTAKDGGDIAKTGEITHYRTTDGSVLIARRSNVKETRFAALHEIYGAAPKVKSLVRLDIEKDALIFEIVCGEYLDYAVMNFTLEPLEFNINKKQAMKVQPEPFAFLRLHKESGVLLQNLNAELTEE